MTSRISGLEGLIVCGLKDYWYVGSIYVREMAIQQETIDTTFARGGFKQTALVGPPTVDIHATATGEMTYSDTKPQLLNEASILELLRAANWKMKSRKEND